MRFSLLTSRACPKIEAPDQKFVAKFLAPDGSVDNRVPSQALSERLPGGEARLGILQ